MSEACGLFILWLFLVFHMIIIFSILDHGVILSNMLVLFNLLMNVSEACGLFFLLLFLYFSLAQESEEI